MINWTDPMLLTHCTDDTRRRLKGHPPSRQRAFSIQARRCGEHYDLSEDFTEQNNLIDQQTDKAQALRNQLRHFLSK